ncbi:MG2 domain-containing protein [Flavobacterium sp. ST-75]|uniref:MG2 domain-containing protein n=1 Tax=Flavobacterium rhizophilum TaxID=3163296 RepID=A0ABW8YBC1_9FLAO
MKKALLLLTLLISFTINAQHYNYKWEKVINYELDGKIKSADAETDKILELARKEHNEPQIIKAFFFKARYIQKLEENAQMKIFKLLKQEKEKVSVPGKALIEYLYASALNDYYNRFKHEINSPTYLENATPENIMEWSSINYNEEIEKAYKKSIENREALYKVPLSNYDAIIQLNPILTKTNRSLYDFLFEQYIKQLEIDRYSNSTGLVLKNSETFRNADFSDYPKNSKAFALFQDIEKFYHDKNDTLNLQRAVLRRLTFFNKNYSYNTPENLQETYLNTLLEICSSWKQSPFLFEAKLKTAQLYHNIAKKDNHPEYREKAIEICDEIINNYRINHVADDAALLKNSISGKSCSIETEKYIIPNKPFLAKVSFRNFDSLYVKLYKVNAGFKTDTTKEITPTILKYDMPKRAPYFEYDTEIILPPLQPGHYLMEVSPTETNENYSEPAKIIVTELTSVEQNEKDHTYYRILNRESGEPVKNAKIIYAEKNYVTNKEGVAIVKNPKYKPNQKSRKKYENPLIYNRQDTLNSNNSVHYYYNEKNKKEEEPEINVSGKIFTDRAIYRPGQTIYFKGIITQEVNSIYSAVPNIYVSVYITDADYNELKTLRLKTNEFGSFSGEFQIPKNAMTGEFEIEVDEDEDYELDEAYNKRKDEHPFWDNENVYFDYFSKRVVVEEYKRPTFEIEFDTIKEPIIINKPAIVTGKAKSLSGANLTEARVKYVIDRSRYCSQSGILGSFTPIKGETTTDKNGKFSIPFTPEAIEGSDENKLPVFSYEINIDVTDINGETQEKQLHIKTGYHDLELSSYIPYDLTEEHKDGILVKSNNLNDHPIPAVAEITIYKLSSDRQSIKKERPWYEPEIQSISKEEFEKNFPYTPYKSREESQSPERERVILSQKIQLKDGSFRLNPNLKEWDTGKYEIVISAIDTTNHIIEKKKTFTFENKEKQPNEYIFRYKELNKNYMTDGYVELELASKLENLYVAVEAYENGNRSYDKITHLQNNKTNIKVPLSPEAENVEIKFYYVWQNDFFTEKEEYNFRKTSNSYLKITSSTLRSNLTPGNNETWSFSITGTEKEKFEVLASMYDTSLDQFTYDSWTDWPYLKEDNYNYYRTPYLETTTGGRSRSRVFEAYTYVEVPFSTYPDKINSYGFNINHSRFIYKDAAKTNGNKNSTEKTIKITGIVSDETGPLPAANVLVKGTQISTQTNLDGEFTIEAGLGSVLQFSFVGHESQEVVVGSQYIYNILLKEGMFLSPVVKDVYRSTTKQKSVMAVAYISSEAIEDRANASVLQSLQGQIAGVSITTASGEPGSESTIILRGAGTIDGNIAPLFIIDGVPVDEDSFRSINQNQIANVQVLKDAAATSIYGNRGANGVIVISTYDGIEKQKEELKKVETRKNLNETAFFYPHLTTNKNGDLTFSFTSPEALTEWRLRLFAHSKQLDSGYLEHLAITQKDLMIVPNMPRFLREADTIVISAKVTNMTTAPKTGNAILILYNAVNMQPIDSIASNSNNTKPFTIAGKNNTVVNWTITVPRGIEGIQYKVVAKAGNYTDGVESLLPVLTNRTLVTESIPIWVKPNETKQYTLENLKNNTSSTLKNHKVVFEYTSNPAWIALQSLPYLMEFEHECSEQLFSRVYANAIAASVLNSNPKIKEVFDSWKKEGKPSKLEQNEELKSIILTETPWLLDAQTEQEKKNRLALLFEFDKMENAMTANLAILEDRQENGAFPWFSEGRTDEYITRHILAGLGHLSKLKITDTTNISVKRITKRGVEHIDDHFIKTDNERTKKNKKLVLTTPYSSLHYLYTRSFYTEQYPVKDSLKARIDKYLNNIKTNWLNYSLYEKGMAALTLKRFGDTITAKKITESLRETSSNNTEWGMYWIENKAGWYWYKSPIETQALLIEAIIEIDNDVESADAMKVWLIKNKQNKHWSTTKATTEAVYALLMQGSDWLSVKDNTTIKCGDDISLNNKLAETKKEAETGYLKLEWNNTEVSKKLSEFSIENKSKVPGYGGLFCQYFEDLDKIQDTQKGLMNITKELYLKVKNGSETSLNQITADSPLKIGDLVTVRIVLNITEDIEYVHLKDMRASGFEPMDVFSGNKYTANTRYYMTTRDAATNFFFDRLDKGTCVLEYDVRVNNAGTFSNGISTIQSMYATEFSGHTKGITIKIIP